MRISRRSSLITAWMACLAIMMAALAPTLSHAFSNERNGALASICSANGAWKAGGLTDQGSGVVHAGNACGFCSLHIYGGCTPDLAFATAIMPMPAFDVAPLTDSTAHVEPAWKAPHARAPPSLA